MIYWEHLGLVTNSEYAVKNFSKIMLYEKNGLYLGDQLLLSMESEKMPMDVKAIEEKIKKYLL